ncbi:EamA-like transporter family-domain-containing protein [Epithele typhae]|uniref:EamA-like transporter family-domain-containing protein n=1 Tax=Epithele typhae TaxID=378194 RepID=UPI00200774B8|nr:EamA-like transporter family-domain-containing protein [Epithele typhae]KAH9939623.1 EamA-like transporter family-domain-containing protein [Epithele typhae]
MAAPSQTAQSSAAESHLAVTQSREAAPSTSLWRALREFVKANYGLSLVASAQIFFALMNVGVKTLNTLDPPVPPIELVFVRMAVTWACCLLYMYCMGIADPFLGPKGVRLLLVQRGIFGFIGLFSLYYSLQYLSLSDATVLQFLSPMFTALASAIFLREHFSVRNALAGLASLIGVVLIARPAFLFGNIDSTIPTIPGEGDAPEVSPAQRLLAVGLALIGALGAAGAYTTIRYIGSRAHTLHNMVAFSSLCVILTTFVMLVTQTPVVVPLRWDWLAILLFIGLAGFVAQTLLTMGLQREAAGRGTIAVYGQIVFATAFEFAFFHTVPPPLSIVGTVIIIGSALYVALSKKSTHAIKGTVTSRDDPAVEDGLLANHEEESGDIDDTRH